MKYYVIDLSGGLEKERYYFISKKNAKKFLKNINKKRLSEFLYPVKTHKREDPYYRNRDPYVRYYLEVSWDDVEIREDKDNDNEIDLVVVNPKGRLVKETTIVHDEVKEPGKPYIPKSEELEIEYLSQEAEPLYYEYNFMSNCPRDSFLLKQDCDIKRYHRHEVMSEYCVRRFYIEEKSIDFEDLDASSIRAKTIKAKGKQKIEKSEV